MKDEYGIHMVAWMILAQVSKGWFGVLAALIAIVYAGLSLYETWNARP